MRRRVSIVFAALLLGAISTVAVAWRLCVWPGLCTRADCTQASQALRIWDNGFPTEMHRAAAWPISPQRRRDDMVNDDDGILQRKGFGLRILDLHGKVGADPQTPNQRARLTTLEAGWPFLGLRCEHWLFFIEGAPRNQSNYYYCGCIVPWPTEDFFQSSGRWDFAFAQRCLPLRPIWPGFALDTAFYAAAWCVLLAAPFALRRLVRRKRGLCGACGYDLRGRGAAHEQCPECGAAVRRKAAVER